jgi:membrane associated rhomboid family serine protease
LIVYSWMERILASFRFLASTALCGAVVVAGTTWLLADASDGARLLAALIALSRPRLRDLAAER